MELKVWVEGIQRIVCGVTESTTCQDVVYALAHATGKTGRFTLIERWRSSERLLAPHEHPLEILTKWGEYSSDVQFILQRSGADGNQLSTIGQGDSSIVPLHSDSLGGGPTPRSDLIRKSLTFSGGHHQLHLHPTGGGSGGKKASESGGQGIIKNSGNSSASSIRSPKQPGSPAQEDESTHVKSPPPPSQDRSLKSPPPYREPPHRTPPAYRDPPRVTPNTTPQQSNLTEGPRGSPGNSATMGAPGLSSGSTGLTSPTSSQPANIQGKSSKSRRSLIKEFRSPPPESLSESDSRISESSTPGSSGSYPTASGSAGGLGGSTLEPVAFNGQYRELVRLVNLQREKLSAQQAELTKFDAEIVFWEGKSREQQRQAEYVARELSRLEGASRAAEEQLRALGGVEEEAELARQQGKTLRSEITLLRSKLANCETELLQCKNKIRLLVDEVRRREKRELSVAEEGDGSAKMDTGTGLADSEGPSLIREVERLQAEVESARQGAEAGSRAMEHLQREVTGLEATIAEKKQQVERLVRELKEANLQSLAIAPPDELRTLLEGPHKPGSTRKMIGSPRQLENAVPTSKNPHGVWV
ncbi:ras association domain-containing protein 8 isoform X2 [Ischnura elegans]|uniref:ras association domain-containing protein 8 isoform X2 n=1 Tax=Ischnura elegans TaxID=197161 RepID=UPI001ED868F9|nr:ras association domain-containing protein 8 isoform X2 [Ischnura elegans]